ncbi:MAG: hypothetical protein IPO07_17770 [Haliscomenobacter sp.]|nr:hypothetical protein [Haliscomenobacter sp.]MBK9490418.1 hypothetical protein [Haliscomenobacter sp.]
MEECLPIEYAGQMGIQLATFKAFANVDTTYRLNMRDLCGRSTDDVVIVRRRRPPQARLNSLREVCFNDTVAIPIYLRASRHISFTYAVNGVAQQSIGNLRQPLHHQYQSGRAD